MPPRAEDDALRARLDLGGVDDRADPSGHAAADVADLVERRVGADFRHRDLRQHGEIREGRAAHIVVDLLAADGEARGAVGHEALALGGADRGAQIGLARQARGALPAFRGVQRDDVVALCHGSDARPDVDHDAGALVPEDRREQAFRIGARARELVGVAHAGGLDLDQHLAGLRTIERHRRDLERLAFFERHRRPHVHRNFSFVTPASVPIPKFASLCGELRNPE
jgi:hypothetical protein